jgi:hypothetical protein
MTSSKQIKHTLVPESPGNYSNFIVAITNTHQNFTEEIIKDYNEAPEEADLKEGYEMFIKKHKYTDDFSLELIQKHTISWILLEFKHYSDNYPFLTLRRWLFLLFSFVKHFCK